METPPSAPATTAPTSGNETRADGERRRAKRRRIQTACKLCQDRKTRCDGNRPACSACDRRGVATHCVYDGDPAPTNYLTTLEERLHRLERNGAAVFSSDSPLEVVKVRQNDSTYNAGSCISAHASTDHPTVSDDADGIATVSMSDGTECLYGASSTIAFMRFYHKEVNGQSGTLRNAGLGDEVAHADKRLPVALPEALSEKDPALEIYPSRKMADDFINCFWDFVYPIFPMLHRPSFMERYQLIWSADRAERARDAMADMEETIFLSTLNIVFAIGSRLSTLVPAKSKATLAEDFYQRSRRIYRFEMLDSMSLSLVQLLLLTAVHLQSTKHAARCWNVVGLAIRVAQGLGLHFDSSGLDAQNQIEQQMRRRAWHACLILDKLMSMTFGRPAMISTNWDVPFPSLVDDEYLCTEGEGVQPQNVHSRLGLFTWSSKLFIILDDILTTFYTNHRRKNPVAMMGTEASVQEILSEVVTLDRRLEAFLDSVPEYLRYTASEDYSSEQPPLNIVVQRQVLHRRYLYTRVLLMRPVLHSALRSAFMPQDSTSTSPSSILTSQSTDAHLLRRFCNLGVTMASQLIEDIYQSLESEHRTLASVSVYFAFGATLVLLASQICPVVDAKTIDPLFEPSWQRCMAILEYYKDQIEQARQAVLALQKLRSTSNTFHAQVHNLRSFASVPSPGAQIFQYQPTYLDLEQFDILNVDPAPMTWLGNEMNNLYWASSR